MIRRVFLLFVLLPLAVVASLGQDNQNATEMDEIFQKGRKWIVMGEALVSPSVGRRVFIINGYECEGDTVVDGHLYSVLSCYSMYDIDNPFDVDEETLFSAEGKRTWKNTTRRSRKKAMFITRLPKADLPQEVTTHLYPDPMRKSWRKRKKQISPENTSPVL